LIHSSAIRSVGVSGNGGGARRSSEVQTNRP
jgi:hypothetical protein